MTLTRKPSDTPKGMVPAALRAIQLLEVLAESREAMSLHELTEKLDLPKSTIHGLCKTLVYSGMVTRYENGTYHLGVRIMDLAQAYLAKTDLTSDFFMIVNETKFMPEETIVLSILDGAEVVYLACRKGTRLFGFEFNMGMRLPANCAASGKAMMSTLPDEWVIGAAKTGVFRKITTKSMADSDALMKNLRQVRRLGYALDMEETRPGMICIGAPVFKAGLSEAVAAIGISMPKSSFMQSQKEQAIYAVKTIAEMLSCKLGGRGLSDA